MLVSQPETVHNAYDSTHLIDLHRLTCAIRNRQGVRKGTVDGKNSYTWSEGRVGSGEARRRAHLIGDGGAVLGNRGGESPKGLFSVRRYSFLFFFSFQLEPSSLFTAKLAW